ncbi:hypothetical protein CI238_11980 [Colletotrichum incanum]|uniref:Uncharacterized protein n=1 Tax=Colletotrichum incanum TaxID=1573173 RepID=A0A166LAA1_COLIC|nr:hypothetical protein CI238_11980 [Colletotrichum incanum]
MSGGLDNDIPEPQRGAQWADELRLEHIGDPQWKTLLLGQRPKRPSSLISNDTNAIVGSVRRVLATNPNYRDVLVSVIRKLPFQAQRTLRLGFYRHGSIPAFEHHNSDDVIRAWPANEFISSSANAMEVTDHGEPAPNTSSGSCAGTHHCSPPPSEWSSALFTSGLKRNAPEDEDDNNQDGSGDRPGKKQPKGDDGPGKCWLCPYFLGDPLRVPRACRTAFTSFSYLK